MWEIAQVFPLLLRRLRSCWDREGRKTEQLWGDRVEVVGEHRSLEVVREEGRKEAVPSPCQPSHSQELEVGPLQWAHGQPSFRNKNSDGVGHGVTTKSTHSLSLNVSGEFDMALWRKTILWRNSEGGTQVTVCRSLQVPRLFYMSSTKYWLDESL